MIASRRNQLGLDPLARPAVSRVALRNATPYSDPCTDYDALLVNRNASR
ncbi:MAG: hypothetical protein OXU19_15785 [bacterium]|nr:hypothetical protein [bacterium]MDE0242483.1 hypothetical protein [bacterium]MDE0418486.1 hypothetical protein [bacterium]